MHRRLLRPVVIHLASGNIAVLKPDSFFGVKPFPKSIGFRACHKSKTLLPGHYLHPVNQLKILTPKRSPQPIFSTPLASKNNYSYICVKGGEGGKDEPNSIGQFWRTLSFFSPKLPYFARGKTPWNPSIKKKKSGSHQLRCPAFFFFIDQGRSPLETLESSRKFQRL